MDASYSSAQLAAWNRSCKSSPAKKNHAILSLRDQTIRDNIASFCRHAGFVVKTLDSFEGFKQLPHCSHVYFVDEKTLRDFEEAGKHALCDCYIVLVLNKNDVLHSTVPKWVADILQAPVDAGEGQSFWRRLALRDVSYADLIATLPLSEPCPETSESVVSPRAQEIVDSSSDFAALMHFDRLVYLNASCRTLLGHVVENNSSVSLDSILSHKQKHLVLREFVNARKKNRMSGFLDVEVVDRNSKRCSLDVHWQKLEYDGGLILFHARDVSLERMAFESLVDSEEKFRSIAHNAPIGLYQCLPNGKCLYVNKSMAKMNGFTSSNDLLLSSPRWQPHCFRDVSQKDLFFQKIENSGYVYNFEAQTTDSGGRTVWTTRNVHSVCRLNGEVQYYEGFVSDIFHLKELERCIKKSRDTIRSLIDASYELIILMTPQGDIVACNKSAARRLKSSPQNVIGKNIYKILLPHIASLFKEKMNKAMQNGYRNIFFAKLKYRTFKVTMAPVHQEGERAIIGCYCNDVTAYDSLTKKFITSISKYTMLFENAGDVIFILDKNYNFLDLNPSACELLGFTSKDLVGTPFSLVTRSDYNSIFNASKSNKINGEASSIRIEILTAESEVIPFEINCKCVSIEETVCFMCIGRDMRPWDNAQAALLKAKEAAESANKAKSDFLSNISHELRTPLSSIMGLIEILLNDNPKEEQIQHLNNVKHASRVLFQLINGILDTAQIEARTFHLKEELVDLHQTIESVYNALCVKEISNEIEFSYFIDSAVPRHCLSDSMRLNQLLYNLCGNALKFTIEGSVHIAAHMFDMKSIPIDAVAVSVPMESLSKEDDSMQILFTIQDTGIGISPQDILRIFDKFTRLEDSHKRAIPGSGLGLAICQGIISRMSGRIWVKSAPDVGTTIYVQIPLQRTQNSDIPLTDSPPSVSTIIHPLSILLAEDNPINLDMLKLILERNGHQIVTASNGFEVLSAVKRNDFDLILMDIYMPQMDGLEASRTLRRDTDTKTASIPIVALTAHAMPGFDKRCQEAGINAYLSKPIAIDQLMKTIVDVVQGESIIFQDEPSRSVIDIKYLVALTGGSDSMVRRICQSYLTHEGEYISAADAAIANYDINELKRVAHSLKSSLSALGAQHGKDIALQVEELARDGDLSGAIDQFLELRKEMAHVAAAIRRYIQQPLPH
ncbi:PAS domain-containing hybrid sensor histidine kinase/response regulator [Desulfovibrio inopinatus]|uniref:PAS domain-containing hybrid sensor histidine kinase/response regulator n=1 Tax=Desulfovibrio inopinatus TaxID=102109 RepID=UPI000481E430|nr:PAS domain S-box protein [Desulfovibrio inopinatus]